VKKPVISLIMNKIEKITKPDLKSINELLIANNLPEIDPQYKPVVYLKAINAENKIVGAIGVEIYGNQGLLRSMVVDQEYRNLGIAAVLLDHLLIEATELKLESLFLLTTTADIYFEGKGFKRINRTEIDEEVKKSSEFSSICPLSSVAMTKRL
jgi:amino-acid N-acetyltransferase